MLGWLIPEFEYIVGYDLENLHLLFFKKILYLGCRALLI